MWLNLLLLLIQQMEQTLAMAKNNNKYNHKNNNIKYICMYIYNNYNKVESSKHWTKW